MEIGAQCHDTQEAFKEYHEYIKSALASLEKGLLIDLHGRGKSDGVTQLGYCLSKEVLKNKDEHDLKNSSISNIGDKDPDALKGSHSLGAFLQNEGLKAVPSPAYPVPASGENSHFFFSIEIIDFPFLSEDVYFAGGFITRHHHNKLGIDAIQIETPRDLRIEEGDEGRRRLGHALGKAISQFYNFHYM